MAVDFDKFLAWAEDRWNGDVVVKGNEIKLNSIFCEDYKHHLWCNPTGGKKERPEGVYRCWKTDERGSLISLVMHVDKCTYDEALERLDMADTSLASLEAKLEDVFSNKPIEIKPVSERGFTLPPHTYKISALDEDNFFRVEAEIYLRTRCLSPRGLYICTNGEYSNRIVIPYYDADGNLIYFNARALSDKQKPKYRGPDNEIVGKGDVIYMPMWPSQGSAVHWTEGEFDAMSLCMAGFYGCAMGGKALGEIQASLLAGYSITLCLDNDKAGKRALPEIASTLFEHKATNRYGRLGYVRPPVQFKDWNEMLEKVGKTVLAAYVKQQEKPLTQDLLLSFGFDSLPGAKKIKDPQWNRKKIEDLL